MPEPELIQRQREAVRSFRRIDRARAAAETAAHKQHEQLTASADAAFKSAQQNADTTRKQALTIAEDQRQNAHRDTPNVLKAVRDRAQGHINSIAAVRNTGNSLVHRAGLDRLWLNKLTNPEIIAPSQAEKELAQCELLTTYAFDDLKDAILHWQKAARWRRTIWLIVLSLIVLIVAILAWTYGDDSIRAGIVALALVFLFVIISVSVVKSL